MLAIRVPKKLRLNNEGTALVEFSLVAWFFFLILMGTVEFSYFIYQYSVASKASQLTARYASVSDPVVQRSDLNALRYSGGTIRCAMNGTCSDGTACDAVMAKIVTLVQGIAPFIAPSNMIIEYQAGDLMTLGEFVPSIKVSFENVSFSTIFLGYLAGAFLPSLDYSVTGEDLSSLPPAMDGASMLECGA